MPCGLKSIENYDKYKNKNKNKKVRTYNKRTFLRISSVLSQVDVESWIWDQFRKWRTVAVVMQKQINELIVKTYIHVPSKGWSINSPIFSKQIILHET